MGRKPASLMNWACIWGFVVLLSVCFSGCKEIPQPETPPPETAHESKAQMVSPEKQAYLDALKNYNDFAAHPKGHVYNVYPKERNVELCYLSAQVLVAAVKVPEFAADLNSDGEIKEWRRWIDIRKLELHCGRYIGESE